MDRRQFCFTSISLSILAGLPSSPLSVEDEAVYRMVKELNEKSGGNHEDYELRVYRQKLRSLNIISAHLHKIVITRRGGTAVNVKMFSYFTVAGLDDGANLDYVESRVRSLLGKETKNA